MTPKALSFVFNQRKIDELNFIKIKNYSVNYTIKRMKRQDTGWEKKIFAKHISNKEFVSIIYILKTLKTP